MSGIEPVYIQISGEAGRMDNYCAAVRGAGGEPRAGYCPAPDPNCAGLLLCGGGDIESARYGQENRGSHPPDRERDRAELALFRAFYEAGKPILGICRGMQLINVALGGDMVQDLPPEQRPLHTSAEGDLVHGVRACPDSLLCGLYGPAFAVNSAHHQAVGRLGEGLRIAARSEDGVPEGLDLPGYPLLGVQFHPERMAFARQRPDTINGETLFFRFLSACRGDIAAFCRRPDGALEE